MTVATGLCALAATEAAAQTPPSGGQIVLNEQLQLGDVFSHQTINVVDAQEQVTVATTAQGNYATVAAQDVPAQVTSNQDMRGDALATTDVDLDGDTQAVVSVAVQARGNYAQGAAYNSEMSVDATQTNSGGLVGSRAYVGGEDARLLDGGSINAASVSNTVDLYAEGSFVRGTIDQTSYSTVQSYSRLESQYVPGDAEVTGTAIVNSIASSGEQTSGQNLSFSQESTGAYVQGESSANSGNAWNLASRARATANQAVIANEGGSVVVEGVQNNTAFVRAAAESTSYDFGRMESYARGAANDVSVGNNDIFVEIDNTQINSGGVEVSSTFSGTNGYDVYVGSDAVGNSVVGYACAECHATMNATNVQTNTGNVQATSQVVVAGSNRAVITGANATGNSATFYVSRPGN